MRSLRIAMIAHGIPANKTFVIAEELGLQDVQDLENMQMFDLLFADAEFRGRLIQLRNTFKRDGEADWPVPADEDWPGLGTAWAGAFLQAWGAHTAQPPAE
jgi:hypothetical protein